VDRLLVEHLGIEEETVHVEDDGGRRMGELHGGPVYGSISSHINGWLVLAFTKIGDMP
jgi:hypothetical protein